MARKRKKKARRKKARGAPRTLKMALDAVRKEKAKPGIDNPRYNLLTSCEGMLRKLVG